MQGNKNQIIGNVNALGMGQLGSKSPNLQSPPQSMANNMGMNTMPMSIANNGTQPMSSMQGKQHFMIVIYTFVLSSLLSLRYQIQWYTEYTVTKMVP